MDPNDRAVSVVDRRGQSDPGKRAARRRRLAVLIAGAVLVGVICTRAAMAQDSGDLITVPHISVEGPNHTPISSPIQLLFLMTVLSLAPFIFMMSTAFMRITIVISFLKTAVGMNQVPNQILMAMGLTMTLYIMAPVAKRVNDTAIQPFFVTRQITDEKEFVTRLASPLQDFMYINTRRSDLVFIIRLSENKDLTPDTRPPLNILLPSFVLSEVKTAFCIGFLLYIPFLVIDMVCASVLMSMGMFMLSPMTVSLPFKLLLFVMINGWDIFMQGLIKGFKLPVYPSP